MDKNLIPLAKIAKHAVTIAKNGKLFHYTEQRLLGESVKANLHKMRSSDLSLTIAIMC
jgi:hypothetical protein